MPSLRRLVRATDWETVRAKLKAGGRKISRGAEIKRRKAIGKRTNMENSGNIWEHFLQNGGFDLGKI